MRLWGLEGLVGLGFGPWLPVGEAGGSGSVCARGLGPLFTRTRIPSEVLTLVPFSTLAACARADDDNPVPDLIDPITLEPVIRPAISPYGHVMGIATWKAVLAERKTCPFTKQPLSWEGCRVLTKSNYQLYADRIIR